MDCFGSAETLGLLMGIVCVIFFYELLSLEGISGRGFTLFRGIFCNLSGRGRGGWCGPSYLKGLLGASVEGISSEDNHPV